MLAILEKRAEDEALLIFRRKREAGGSLSYTEISDAISVEINGHYARLFDFFRSRPALAQSPAVPQGAPVAPAAAPARERPVPAEDRAAAREVPVGDPGGEIASTIVYRGGFERDLEGDLNRYAAKMFS